MDITNFVAKGRDSALLYGDYATYHAQLSRRLTNSRRKLGIATRNRGKFQNKGEVTSQNVADNHEYVHLLLLTSERAWAQAMSFKAAHATEQNRITGRNRSHITSRLVKASRAADNLVQVLSETAVSGASNNDVLEARAYAALIGGAMQFERQRWEDCLRNYAIAWILYSALAIVLKQDIFKDLLSETIDPSIRYAAYQLKTPRTTPIQVIARDAFPHSDEALVQDVNAINPEILKAGGADSSGEVASAEGVPRTITWRSREVRIEDAQIASTWGRVLVAKSKLAETLGSGKQRSAHEVAGTYDEVLMTTRDAVDATKQAIDEMRGEGVAQSDPRMQSLQITRTAVNFEMISWRVGRNRVLTGPEDGASEQYGSLRKKKKTKTEETPARAEKELPPSRKLAKLKEKVALYDGTLQNLESIKELPGVAADEELASKIDVFEKYFLALKCLSIGRSHAIVGEVANALALINHSSSLCQAASKDLPTSTDSSSSPLNVEVSPASITSLSKLLDGELQRHRAIVHIDTLRKQSKNSEHAAAKAAPLIERLHEYPVEETDLDNIVEFPPKMAPIPMKPIFLDVAWNYIGYPGKTNVAASQASGKTDAPAQPAQQKKSGWFGFGR